MKESSAGSFLDFGGALLALAPFFVGITVPAALGEEHLKILSLKGLVREAVIQ